jgi:hypothetical protein
MTAEKMKKAFHPAVKVIYDKGDPYAKPLATYLFLYRTRGKFQEFRRPQYKLIEE